MAQLIVAPVCSKFCSLLLSKALVLLEIPELKKIIDSCSSSGSGCCGRGREGTMERLAEKKAYKIIKNFDKDQISFSRKAFLEGSKSTGVNVIFEKINKNIII